MSLTRTHPVLLSVVDLLREHLPARFTVDTELKRLAGDVVLVEPVWGPNPQWFTAGGPSKATAGVQVTIGGPNRQAVRLAGDTVRDVLCGTTRGRATHPLTRPGYTFDLPQTGGDGHADTHQGINTWLETYRITWQYYAPDGS